MLAALDVEKNYILQCKTRALIQTAISFLLSHLKGQFVGETN